MGCANAGSAAVSSSPIGQKDKGRKDFFSEEKTLLSGSLAHFSLEVSDT
jgi:hypothetical protein